MHFKPSLRGSTVGRVVGVLAVAIALASLVRYHVGIAWTARVLARPVFVAGRLGEALVTGRAHGKAIVLPSGESVLAAYTQVWDRPRGRKGARVLCTDVVFAAIEVDGHAVDWHPAPSSALEPTTRRYFGDDAALVFVDLTAKAQGKPIPAGKCAVESALAGRDIEVRALRDGDIATVAGCFESGAIRPCGDGRDLFSSRDPAAAERAMRVGEAPFLVAAAFLGIPSWVWLVLFLSRHTATLSRSRER